MANREVTVRLSADISSYINSMDQAAEATDRAATAADNLEQAASRVSQSTQQSSQGFQQAGDAAESASTSMEGLGTATQQAGEGASDASGSMEGLGSSTQSAAEGASASSEALYRLSGGLSGTASEADSMGTSISAAGDGLSGLSSSFAEGLEIGGGFGATLAAIGSAARDTLAGGLRAAGEAGRDFFTMARDNRQTFNQWGASMAVVGGGLTALIGSLVRTGIEYNTLQQVAGRALETMTGSASAAADQMERLHAFADESPFARQTWIQAQQQLMAFGMEAERVVPTLEGIQNAVAAIGGGDQEIMQLVDILGSVEGQGRMTGRELQRMGQMGINAADLMGQSLGMTGAEIREQITAGAMDAETAITALADGMNTTFAGAAENLRETMPGAIDRLQARIRDLGGVLATPLVDPNGGGFLVEAINQAADFGSTLLDLPDPLLQIVGLASGAAGGALLLGAGFAFAAPRVMNFVDGTMALPGLLRDFGQAHPGMTSGLRGIGSAAVIAAAGIAAIAVLDHVWDRIKTVPPDIREAERALRELGRTGQATEGITDFSAALDHLDTTGGKISSNVPGWAAVLVAGFSGNPGVVANVDLAHNLADSMEVYDQALAGMIDSGNHSSASSAMQALAEDFANGEKSVEELVEAFPTAIGALRDLADAAGVTADDTRLVEIATSEAGLAALMAGENWTTIVKAWRDGAYHSVQAAEGATTLLGALSPMTQEAQAAAEALSDIVEAYTALGLIQVDAQTQIGNYHAAVRELNTTLEENGDNLRVNTEEGQANWNAMDSLGSQAWDTAEAMAASGQSVEEVTRYLEGANEGLAGTIEGMTIGADQARTLGEQFGWSSGRIQELGEGAALTSEEAQQLADMLLRVPGNVESEFHFEAFGVDALDAITYDINNLPDEIELFLNAQPERAQQVLETLLTGDYEATIELLGDDEYAQAVIQAFEDGGYEAVARIMGDAAHADNVIFDFTNGEYLATADVDGNISPASEAMAAFLNEDYSTAARIMAEDTEAQATVLAFINDDYQTTAFLHGNDDSANDTMRNFTDTPWMTDILALAETAPAEAVLDEVTRDRIATVMAEADSWNAEGVLTETARERIAAILAESNTGVAESDLNGTARQRIADILAEPNTFNAEGQLTDTARQRIADILAEALTWGAESDLNNTSRDRTSTVNANANTWLAEMQLNRLARNRSATIRVGVSGSGVGALIGRGMAGGGLAGLRGYSTGGHLPYTGLGVDKILGINSHGMPIARLDDGEFITKESATRKFLPALWALNRDDPKSAIASLQGFAEGGRAGSMRPREYPVANRAGAAIDYDRLAGAIGSGGRTIQLNQTNHNPVRETDIEAALRGIDNLSIWDTSGTGGDR